MKYSTTKTFTDLLGNDLNFFVGNTFRDALAFSLNSPILNESTGQVRPLTQQEAIAHAILATKLLNITNDEIELSTDDINALQNLFRLTFQQGAFLPLSMYLNSAKAI